MKIQILRAWEDVSQSFWFTPIAIAAAGLVLALVLVCVGPWLLPYRLLASSRLDLAGSSGANSILATIASSAITVAGVVFSITILVLNMASSQFGPRLLPNFMQQGATQIALGTFVGTFIYCLTALSIIHIVDTDAAVAQLAVAVGVVLGVASSGVLIYFIHHVAIFIQAPRIIDVVAKQLHSTLGAAFPPLTEGRQIDTAKSDAPKSHAALIAGRPVLAEAAGYVQAIDPEGLLTLAMGQDLRILLLVRPGEYVSVGDEIAQVAGEAQDAGAAAIDRAVRAKLVLGPQRTPTQDPVFGVCQLVEVALRALSPGINDPFTAISCIDHLGNALAFLASRESPSHLVWDTDDNIRLQLDAYTYRSIVNAAFDRLRRTSVNYLDVTLRLLEVIANLMARELPADLRRALADQAHAIRESARQRDMVARDEAALAATWAAIGAHLEPQETQSSASNIDEPGGTVDRRPSSSTHPRSPRRGGGLGSESG